MRGRGRQRAGQAEHAAECQARAVVVLLAIEIATDGLTATPLFARPRRRRGRHRVVGAGAECQIVGAGQLRGVLEVGLRGVGGDVQGKRGPDADLARRRPPR